MKPGTKILLIGGAGLAALFLLKPDLFGGEGGFYSGKEDKGTVGGGVTPNDTWRQPTTTETTVTKKEAAATGYIPTSFTRDTVRDPSIISPKIQEAMVEKAIWGSSTGQEYIAQSVQNAAEAQNIMNQLNALTSKKTTVIPKSSTSFGAGTQYYAPATETETKAMWSQLANVAGSAPKLPTAMALPQTTTRPTPTGYVVLSPTGKKVASTTNKPSRPGQKFTSRGWVG